MTILKCFITLGLFSWRTASVRIAWRQETNKTKTRKIKTNVGATARVVDEVRLRCSKSRCMFIESVGLLFVHQSNRTKKVSFQVGHMIVAQNCVSKIFEQVREA